MLHSIRSRLVISYTVLVLLTVSGVGFLAFSLVRNYMRQGERDYLTANAQAVARQAEPLLSMLRPTAHESDREQAGASPTLPPPPMLAELVETSALLGNVRVRIFDVAGRILADSGAPGEQGQIAWIVSALSYPAQGDFTAAPHRFMPLTGFVVDMPDGLGAGPPLIPIYPWMEELSTVDVQVANATAPDDVNVLIVRTEPSQWGNRFVFDVTNRQVDEFVWQAAQGHMPPELRRVSPSDDRVEPGAIFTLTSAISGAEQFVAMAQKGAVITEARPAVPLSASGEFSSGDAAVAAAEQGASAPRSPQVVTVSIGAEQAPLGFVELSEGPDFGSEALAAIRRAFGLAAAGASLIAVLVGLVMGRGLTAPLLGLMATTSRMSSGDLSARAPIHGSDETAVLARQFNQMAGQLESSFAALAAERDALRRFITDASHELRTPIMALKTFNELLQGPARADAAAQTEFLQESQRQIQRMEWVTANLLDLSRLDAGLAELTLEKYPLADLLVTVAAPFQTLASQRGLTFNVVQPAPAAQCTCDPARLELALANLLDNAFKFTSSGGTVELGATCEGKESAQTVSIWVEDNGPGIPPQVLPHIFDRFYRHGVEGERDAGSGLGLAIAKAIVQAHGGVLRAESEVGVGSQFVIELVRASE